MARLQVSQVKAALSNAGKVILAARGGDTIVSRAELKAYVAGANLSRDEKALASIFYSFIDHRDAAAGARITSADVKKAVNYATEKLIQKYDVNRNGLSADEIAKMSTTGKLAVRVARANAR